MNQRKRKKREIQHFQGVSTFSSFYFSRSLHCLFLILKLGKERREKRGERERRKNGKKVQIVEESSDWKRRVFVTLLSLPSFSLFFFFLFPSLSLFIHYSLFLLLLFYSILPLLFSILSTCPRPWSLSHFLAGEKERKKERGRRRE